MCVHIDGTHLIIGQWRCNWYLSDVYRSSADWFHVWIVHRSADHRHGVRQPADPTANDV